MTGAGGQGAACQAGRIKQTAPVCDHAPVQQRTPRAVSSRSAATVTGMQQSLSRQAAPLPLPLSCVPPAIAPQADSASDTKLAATQQAQFATPWGCVGEQAFNWVYLQGLLGVAGAESSKDALPGGVNTSGRIKVHCRCHILVLHSQEGLQLTRTGWIAAQCCLHDRDALLVHQAATSPSSSAAQESAAN